MKSDRCCTARRIRGFTLVELLVVIAVISILAALLLPALSRAKSTAKSAACRSNLHQIGIALSLYVQEFDKYPFAKSVRLNTTDSWSQIYQFPALPGWHGALLPYCGGAQRIFDCPVEPAARRPRDGSMWDSRPPIVWFSYGYNAGGTGLWSYALQDPGGVSLDAALGLGGLGVGVMSEYYVSGAVRTAPVQVPASVVLAPSQMIAFADCAPTNYLYGDAYSIWLSSDGLCIQPDTDRFPFPLPPPVFRHDQGANGVFCDAHVEFGKAPAWVGKADDVRGRWNNDHQPHPETWRD